MREIPITSCICNCCQWMGVLRMSMLDFRPASQTQPMQQGHHHRHKLCCILRDMHDQQAISVARQAQEAVPHAAQVKEAVVSITTPETQEVTHSCMRHSQPIPPCLRMQ